MKLLNQSIADDLETVSSSSSLVTKEGRRNPSLTGATNSSRQRKIMGMATFLSIIVLTAILLMVVLMGDQELEDSVHHHQHHHHPSVVATNANDIRSKDGSSSPANGNGDIDIGSTDERANITTDIGVEGHHHPELFQSTIARRHLQPADEMVASLKESRLLQLSFRRGDLAVTVPGLGIKVCTGMQVRVIARAGQKVPLSNGGSSKLPFHSMPDGATVLPYGNNGHVYVSNSEMKSSRGGVYGVYFSNAGQVVDYQPLLQGSTRNCGGGRTPWNTWISCEEFGSGQCWQIDPTNRNPPQITQLGGSKGGNYESVAVDNRNLSRPIFFVTEDAEYGALRRYTPPPSVGPKSIIADWNTLHRSGGSTDYLMFLDSTHFKWTANEQEGRSSQFQNYPNVEGIDFHNGHLYFVSKKLYKMYVLNLEDGTYTTSSTKFGGGDAGEFWNSPDQIIRNNDGGGGKYIYLTEDGGKTVGVYAICQQTGEKFSMFEAYDGHYKNDETTGLAFSPDGRKMYAAFQDCGCSNSESGLDPSCGCLLEFSRKDGLSFDGSTLDIKFHSS